MSKSKVKNQKSILQVHIIDFLNSYFLIFTFKYLNTDQLFPLMQSLQMLFCMMIFDQK